MKKMLFGLVLVLCLLAPLRVEADVSGCGACGQEGMCDPWETEAGRWCRSQWIDAGPCLIGVDGTKAVPGSDATSRPPRWCFGHYVCLAQYSSACIFPPPPPMTGEPTPEPIAEGALIAWAPPEVAPIIDLFHGRLPAEGTIVDSGVRLDFAVRRATAKQAWDVDPLADLSKGQPAIVNMKITSEGGERQQQHVVALE